MNRSEETPQKTSTTPTRAALAGGCALAIATIGMFGAYGLSGTPAFSASSQTTPGAAAPTVSAPATLPAPVELSRADPNIFVNLSKQAMPSVVNISTRTHARRTARNPGYLTPEDLFRGFGMMPDHSMQQPRGSLGTGFVIETSGNGTGIILTNHHVISGSDEIKISFTEDPDEKPVEAEVLGKDPELDVALLRVKTDRKLVALPLGDSEALQVGEYVAAMGNPFGQGHSISHGIVSAKGRIIPGLPMATYLQTDAPINPGNSGGPLLNLKGEVIGVNNAIDARAQGIGFAIPINFVKPILAKLKTGESISRGYLGAIIGTVPNLISERSGPDPKDPVRIVIGQVYVGSPADQAGLKPRDVVLEFNGKPIRTSQELVTAVSSHQADEKVKLKIQRDGRTRTVDVRLGKRPTTES